MRRARTRSPRVAHSPSVFFACSPAKSAHKSTASGTPSGSGGISNPLEVIEQITYLLFIKRLDDLHTLEEAKATRLKRPMERRVFPEGRDGIGKGKGRDYADLRWSRFKHFAPADMLAVVGEHVFPFLRTLGGDGRTARALEALMLQRTGLRDTLFIAMSNYYYEQKTGYGPDGAGPSACAYR